MASKQIQQQERDTHVKKKHTKKHTQKNPQKKPSM